MTGANLGFKSRTYVNKISIRCKKSFNFWVFFKKWRHHLEEHNKLNTKYYEYNFSPKIKIVEVTKDQKLTKISIFVKKVCPWTGRELIPQFQTFLLGILTLTLWYRGRNCWTDWKNFHIAEIRQGSVGKRQKRLTPGGHFFLEIGHFENLPIFISNRVKGEIEREMGPNSSEASP